MADCCCPVCTGTVMADCCCPVCTGTVTADCCCPVCTGTVTADCCCQACTGTVTADCCCPGGMNFVFPTVPCHRTAHRVSPCTLLLAHSVPVQMKNKKDGNLRALVAGRSLFRLLLSGTTFLLTSDTAVLSYGSKLLLKLFSLLLPTLS